MNSKGKSALKKIVKECLIEILAEGLVSGRQSATLRETRELRGAMQESHEMSVSRNISEQRLSQQTSVMASKPAPSKRNSYLDSIKMGIDNSENKNSKEEVQSKMGSLTKDPIMSEIFADTALTTLQEQREGSRPSGPSVRASGDQAAKIVDQSAPEELFGDSAGKWANLAFAPSIRK